MPCWVMAVCVWFLGFGLSEPRNVLSALIDCNKILNKESAANQTPLLKFSPSNSLHFLNKHPSPEFNHFWATKPFVQPYPNFTMAAILVVWHKNGTKSKSCSFDKACIIFNPKVNENIKHKWNQMKRKLSKLCSHILPFDACRGFFYCNTLLNV